MPFQEDAPRVVPVDDFVRDELYPGYQQPFGSQPFVAGPVRPFSRADNARYWLRARLRRRSAPLAAPARMMQTVDPANLEVPFSNEPVVSVIVPTYGQLPFTLRCLASVAAHAPSLPIASGEDWRCHVAPPSAVVKTVVRPSTASPASPSAAATGLSSTTTISSRSTPPPPSATRLLRT